MKYSILILALLMTLGFTACAIKPTPSPVSPTTIQSTSVSSTGNRVINTKLGQFSISSARFVEEVNGDKPGPGEKILLVILAGPGGEALKTDTFSLEEFQKMIHDSTQGTIHILGNDGSETISTMAGWVGPEYTEFAIGFRVPSSDTIYQLVWPGNDPIEIIAEE